MWRASFSLPGKEVISLNKKFLKDYGTNRINAELAEGLIESMYLYGDGRLEINFGFRGGGRT